MADGVALPVASPVGEGPAVAVAAVAVAVADTAGVGVAPEGVAVASANGLLVGAGYSNLGVSCRSGLVGDGATKGTVGSRVGHPSGAVGSSGGDGTVMLVGTAVDKAAGGRNASVDRAVARTDPVAGVEELGQGGRTPSPDTRTTADTKAISKTTSTSSRLLPLRSRRGDCSGGG